VIWSVSIASSFAPATRGSQKMSALPRTKRLVLAAAGSGWTAFRVEAVVPALRCAG
jgi:hypothetical protein